MKLFVTSKFNLGDLFPLREGKFLLLTYIDLCELRTACKFFTDA